MDPRDAALDLTDYVLGRLDAPRREQVAAALAADPELQAFAAWLRQVHQLLSLTRGGTLGHPDAAPLVDFALDPDAADPVTAAHAVSCPQCRDLVAATRAVEQDRAGSKPLLARLHGALLRVGSGRIIAAGAVVSLVALLAVGVVLRPDAELPGGPVPSLHVAAAVRGAAPEPPTASLGGGPLVMLQVDLDPFAGSDHRQVSLVLELRRAGRVAYRWSGPAAEVWHPATELLTVLVPTAALAPGDHELLIDLDGATVLQRTIRLRP